MRDAGYLRLRGGPDRLSEGLDLQPDLGRDLPGRRTLSPASVRFISEIPDPLCAPEAGIHDRRGHPEDDGAAGCCLSSGQRYSGARKGSGRVCISSGEPEVTCRLQPSGPDVYGIRPCIYGRSAGGDTGQVDGRASGESSAAALRAESYVSPCCGAL